MSGFGRERLSMEYLLFARGGQWPQLQADEGELSVGQVTDDLTDRIGQIAYQRRDGDELVFLRQPRVDDEIDGLDLVLPGQMLLANALQVLESVNGLRSLSRNVETKIPLVAWRRSPCAL